MSNFTKEQKSAFLSLAKEYNQEVYKVASRGDSTEIVVLSEREALLFNNFANTICDIVISNFPDVDGVDADVNADAEMVVFMVTDILSDVGFEI